MAEPARCPDDNQLAELISGLASDEARREIDLHIDQCADCSRWMAEIGASLEVDALEEPAPAGSETLSSSRYRLLDKLGAGGMGVVYEAEDRELGRHVALKLLSPRASGDREHQRARLLREARLLAQLQHPNVIAVHDAGVIGEQVFVALELVRGRSAAQWCADAARGWRDVVEVFTQAGAGLAAAHAAELVHRDVKPSNILVGDSGRVWITDFGLAGDGSPESDQASAATAEGDVLAAHLTRTGELLGTPAYMAPEQLQGLHCDARSDQFSFAASVWQSIYGARPFPGDHVIDIERAFARGLPAQPRDLDATGAPVPKALRACLERALSIDPKHRFETLADLLASLGRVSARRSTAKRNALVAAMAMTAALAALALVWFAGRASIGTEPDRATAQVPSTDDTHDHATTETAAELGAEPSAAPPAIALPDPPAPTLARTPVAVVIPASAGAPRKAPPKTARRASTGVPAAMTHPRTRVQGPWKRHYDDATTAAVARNPGLCLRELDRADALVPAEETVVLRSVCEMQSGDCRAGTERLTRHLELKASKKQAAQNVLLFDARNCDASRGPLERRLARIGAQGLVARALPNKLHGRRVCKRLVRAGASSLAEAARLPSPPAGLGDAQIGLIYCEILLQHCELARQHLANWARGQGTKLEYVEPHFAQAFAGYCAKPAEK